MEPQTPAAGGSRRKLAFLLASLSAVGPFCIDAYLPSMPDISRIFGIPLLAVQQTLTAYMVPFAVMTLWHGALSDAFGRRRVILTAFGLFALASLGCAASPSIHALLLCRALQGMTAGAGMVVGRAIVRDLHGGPEAQRMMSLVTIVFAVAPAVAPVIGGWLHTWFGWRAVFVFMAAFALVVWELCRRLLPESLPVHKRQPFRPGYLARTYRRVLTSGPFVAASVALAAGFSAFFLYVLSAPVFLMQHLKLPATQFLWLFGPFTVGMVLGAFASGRLAGRLSPLRTVVLAASIMGLAAAGNLVMNLLFPPGLPHSVLPLFFYAFGQSILIPSVTLLSLDLFPAQRGLAASCQSFVQSTGNAITAAFLAPLFWATPLRLAVGEALLFSAAALALAVLLRSLLRMRRGQAPAAAPAGGAAPVAGAT